MLTLYDGTTSVCAIKVRLALHEKGIAFDSHNIDLRAGEQFDPGYLKLNPNGEADIGRQRRRGHRSSAILQCLEDFDPISAAARRGARPGASTDRMKRVDDAIHPVSVA